MESILINHANVIFPNTGIIKECNILIENGKIKSIGDSEACADWVIDAHGLYAAPGLVDIHVHTREPGFTYKEDIMSASKAAAAGGVTTILAMPNTSPVIDNVIELSKILKKAALADINVLQSAAISVDQDGIDLTDFPALAEAGAYAFSDDGKPVGSSELLSEALKKADRLNIPVLDHCEDTKLADNGLINDGNASKRLNVKGIPVSSEVIGIKREIEVAQALNKRIHICHVSTADSVELIRKAKANGVKVTAETAPHYFSLTEDIITEYDADYRMNPPLRTEKDRLAIIEGLVDGTLDAIATDHAPHSIDDKSDFFKAPNGIVGLETSLAAGITYLVNTGDITLEKLMFLMSTAPAKIININKGLLIENSDADIVLFDKSEEWIVDVNNFKSKSRNSSFKNMKLCGRVKYTICNGKIVYEYK